MSANTKLRGGDDRIHCRILHGAALCCVFAAALGRFVAQNVPVPRGGAVRARRYGEGRYGEGPARPGGALAREARRRLDGPTRR